MEVEYPKIEILMATYNGEKYIEEQIKSLFKQTYKNWTLLIRDDGSKDNTVGIIRKYEKENPNRIKFLEDKKGGLKAKNNFLELLRNSQEEYVMFCDQDDIWLPNKIELTLKKMLEVEIGPTLIHTDLKVVDEKLKIISNSFWKFQNLDPNRKKYNHLIVQNNITGCTMMVNKELIALCKEEFKNGIMHDWVIGIIASLKGKIEYIDTQTILYRQHGKNDVGAKKYNLLYFLEKFINNRKELKKNSSKSREQIKEIALKLKLEIREEESINEYISLENKKNIYRKFWLIKNGYLKTGVYRKIGQIFCE